MMSVLASFWRLAQVLEMSDSVESAKDKINRLYPADLRAVKENAGLYEALQILAKEYQKIKVDTPNG